MPIAAALRPCCWNDEYVAGGPLGDHQLLKSANFRLTPVEPPPSDGSTGVFG